MEERKLQWGEGGILNPTGSLACGALDAEAHVLVPVHWGGCKGCKAKISGILKARYPAAPKGKPPKQAEFDFGDVEEG